MKSRYKVVAMCALFLTSALLPGGVAQADPGNTCLNYPNAFDCDGTDPYRTGCDVGAFIANSAPVNYYDPNNGLPTGGVAGTVYNWYSPTCGTNWAEFRSNNGLVLYGAVGITALDGSDSEEYQDYGYDLWSDQLYAPTPSLAKAWAQVQGPAYGEVTC